MTRREQARPMVGGGDLSGAGILDGDECNGMVCFLNWDTEMVIPVARKTCRSNRRNFQRSVEAR